MALESTKKPYGPNPIFCDLQTNRHTPERSKWPKLDKMTILAIHIIYKMAIIIFLMGIHKKIPKKGSQVDKKKAHSDCRLGF